MNPPPPPGTSRAASGILHREHLIRPLQTHAVAWISGPAGAGKTTLAATCLEGRDGRQLWYQLDESDAEPANLFHHLKQAAEEELPDHAPPLPQPCPELLANLSAFTRRFFALLYRRLGHNGVLVLDDCHHLPPDAPELVLWGLTVLPPGTQAILISRHAPPPALARLQLYGELVHLDWLDLRLREDEALALAELQGTGLDPETVRRLYRDTDGWIAGLVLMLSRPGNAAATANRRLLFDYFATEILATLPEPSRRFLHRTALLPVVRIDTAERLTGHDGAAAVLEDLRRRQLFVRQRSGTLAGYVYHPLLREFLLARLAAETPPAELARLRRTAAELLTASGQVEAAAALLIDNQDWERLATLILSQARDLAHQGRLPLLERWLRALPPARRECDPWLLFWQAQARLPADPPAARELFERALAGFETRHDDTGVWLSWSGIVQTHVYYWDDFRPLDRWLKRWEALRRHHPVQAPETEAQQLTALVAAIAYRQPHHPERERWLGHAHRLLEDPAIPAQLRLPLATHLCLWYGWAGDLSRLRTLLPLLSALAARSPCSPLAAIMAHGMGAIEAWLSAKWEDCRQAVRDGLALAERTGVTMMNVELLSQAVYASASTGDVEGAETWLRRLEPWLAQAPPAKGAQYQYLRSWLAFLRGDLAASRSHAEQGLRTITRYGLVIPQAFHHLALAQIRFEAGERKAAAGHLDQALALAERTGSRMLGFRGGMLAAWFAFAAGREDVGLEALRRALRLGREGGLLNHDWWTPGIMAPLCLRALEHDIETDYVRRLIRQRALPPPEITADRWPWPVKIYTLGRFSVVCQDEPLHFSGKAQKRPLDLLKVLIALGGRDVEAARIVDCLWPEAEGDNSHEALKVNLKRLRRLLGDPLAVELSAGHLTLDPHRCWVDIWAFERLLGQARQRDDADAETVRALALYHGPFLDQETDAAWALAMRQRLQRKFIQAVLTRGRRQEAAHHWHQAVADYQRALEAEPLCEELYQRLMHCHLQLGQHAEAARTYHQCREMLANHLGTTPSARTEALYRHAHG